MSIQETIFWRDSMLIFLKYFLPISVPIKALMMAVMIKGSCVVAVVK